MTVPTTTTATTRGSCATNDATHFAVSTNRNLDTFMILSYVTDAGTDDDDDDDDPDGECAFYIPNPASNAVTLEGAYAGIMLIPFTCCGINRGGLKVDIRAFNLDMATERKEGGATTLWATTPCTGDVGTR